MKWYARIGIYVDSDVKTYFAKRNRFGCFSWVSDPKKAKVFKSREEVVRYLKKNLHKEIEPPCCLINDYTKLDVLISVATDEDIKEYEKQKQCE